MEYDFDEYGESMRIVFAGTPGFSVPCLTALLEADDIDVVGVVSQPDRKSGRGMKLTPSAVKQAALDAGIDVITPEKLRDNDEALTWLESKQADILVVVAFGMILPKTWLDAPSIAAVNVHASLLPRWRGAAPIERALLAGDKQTGVCIMQMEEGLDTGGVYARTILPISNQTTGSELWFKLSPMGAELLIDTLPAIATGLLPAPQTADGQTYAKKISNDERIIDW
ncbi:methionyl-tRNA formyltransferase, partial [Mariprofundus ferrooxydans]|nr:methionyl-tRNA formyltransferase [Mariprofundus ferrooxydans]